jgi:hypothetical protein
MPRESNQVDRSPDDLLKYPRFDERQVVLRWAWEWWDGPVNGSISYRDDRYWFEFYCDTDEPGYPYYYLVYPLTVEEVDFADTWRAEYKRFQDQWVPLANDAVKRDLPSTKQLAAEWETHASKLPRYSDRQPVAWFETGSNPSFYGIQVQPPDNGSSDQAHKE